MGVMEFIDQIFVIFSSNFVYKMLFLEYMKKLNFS